jgi:hypothetical protein
MYHITVTYQRIRRCSVSSVLSYIKKSRQQYAGLRTELNRALHEDLQAHCHRRHRRLHLKFYGVKFSFGKCLYLVWQTKLPAVRSPPNF